MRAILTLALALGAITANAAECRGRVGLTVDVVTKRNATGHRQVKADVRRIDPQAENGKVHMVVEQSICIADGVRQFQLTTLIEAPESEPRSAPAGYELAPGLGWYRFHLTVRTWDEARRACEEEGAHLAVVNSPQEADVLKRIFARAPTTIPNSHYSDGASIGFSDVVEGRYLTIFGQTLEEAGYAVWESGQPNNSAGRIDKDSNCGALTRSGKVNDIACRGLYAYICESSL